MGDYLTYRIPGKKPVQSKGIFVHTDDIKNVSGFIVTSFDKNQNYHFVEQEASATITYSSESPLCINQIEYEQNAQRFLNDLISENLGKAVYSRIKSVTLEVDLMHLFNDLCDAYPFAFVYLMSSPHFGTWIGATPEVLIQSTKNNASTMSLAGTLSSDSNSDWKSKERIEQNLVTAYIEKQLLELGLENITISQALEKNAGPVKHLQTMFNFELAPHTAIEVGLKLHPTPAVSGFPQQDALNLIRKHEKHNRKLYAGMIGISTENESHIFVNLRCAEVINNNAYLYLGGGFTKDSSVQAEWYETENKARTLENIIHKNSFQ